MEIEKIIKKISLLHSSSTETPTSFVLAEEIVNKMQIDWSDPTLKFLDPSCGRGTFLLALLKKLEEHGHSREHIISNMLYGIDINSVQQMIAKKALKLACENSISNIYCDDILTKVWDMKFKGILGNPPYQASTEDGERKDQAANLWSKITYKCIEEHLADNGYIGFVIPNSWMSPSADIGKGESGVRFFEDYFKKYNTVAVNIDECAKHFPGVGSNFTYFVMQKTEKDSAITDIVTPNGKFSLDLRDITYLPKVVSPVTLSINKKVLESGRPPFGFTNNNQPETRIPTSKTNNSNFPVQAYHTGAKGGTYWYIEKPIATANLPKVILSISGNYKPFYDLGGMSFTGMCIVYYLNDTDNMDSIKSILESKLWKYVVNINTLTGWLSPVFRELPRVDTTKIWSDQELYKEFNLTDEEILEIESYKDKK